MGTIRNDIYLTYTDDEIKHGKNTGGCLGCKKSLKGTSESSTAEPKAGFKSKIELKTMFATLEEALNYIELMDKVYSTKSYEKAIEFIYKNNLA